MLNPNEQEFCLLITLFTVWIVCLSLLAALLYKILFRIKTKNPTKGKR